MSGGLRVIGLPARDQWAVNLDGVRLGRLARDRVGTRWAWRIVGREDGRFRSRHAAASALAEDVS